jgi:glutamate synthase (NADPH/NADH) large chain
VRKGASSPARCSSSTPPRAASSSDEEIKAELAAEQPYGEWLAGEPGCILDDLPEREHIVHTARVGRRRQQTFGYTHEELRQSSSRRWPRPAPSRSGRWAPTPRSRCCRPAAAAVRLLHAALRAGHEPAARRDPRGARHLPRPVIGPEGNLLDGPGPRAPQSIAEFPVIDNDELAKLVHITPTAQPGFAPTSSAGSTTCPGGEAMAARSR